MLYITLTILLTAVFINLVRPSSYHVDELDYDDQLMRNAERQKLSVLLIPILVSKFEIIQKQIVGINFII